MKTLRLLSFLLLPLLCVPAVNAQNKTLRVYDGETGRGGSTVNGSVLIGRDCEARGKYSTVNGRIEVEDKSRVRDLSTVNGRIRIRDEVIVDGDLEAVNGDISCSRDVQVDGRIETVNGSIRLEKTTVKQGLRTLNGDIRLREKSIVKGDIIIERQKGWKGWSNSIRRLDVEITGDSVVEGDIRVLDEDIEVTVYLSSGGAVNGRIEGAEVVKR